MKKTLPAITKFSYKVEINRWVKIDGSIDR